MTRALIAALVIVAAALIAAAASPPGASRVIGPEKAIVEFTEQVKLLDVFLRGEYLVVHDEERMARGEACLYVYRLEDRKLGKLVVSFHCERVKRENADRFTVLVSRRSSPFDVPEVREIQFQGSTDGHRVPIQP